MTGPLISVVIPSYNHAHFISRALTSLKEQIYTNWEAIIVDNHSEDSTDELVSQFSDPRISLLKIHNKGIIAASRNLGISVAQGDWIAFLDSDDWWTPDKLLLSIESINSGADLIYHDLKVVRETPSRFERDNARSRHLKKPVLMDLLLNDNAISNSSVIVRKSLLTQIGGLDENPLMAGAEDYNAWLRIARQTDRYDYIPRFLGFYQVHAQGISRKDMSVCYENAIAEFVPILSKRQRNRINGTLAYIRGKHHFQNKRPDQAIQELKRSVKIGGVGIKFKSICALSLIFLTRAF